SSSIPPESVNERQACGSSGFASSRKQQNQLMPFPVTIPKATLSMEEGMIARWLKVEGQVVAQGEPLFELETDKAVAEVESPVNGTLLRIIIPEGSVRVEQIVAWVGKPGELMDETSTAPVSRVEEDSETASKLPDSDPCARVAKLPTPAARRRAKELGIVVANITGTGPEGRITEEDVERLHRMQIGIASRHTSPKKVRRTDLIRKLVASWQSIPHIHIARHMDASGLISARPVAKSRFSPDVSVTDLILFALSRVL